MHQFQTDPKFEVSKDMNDFIFWITLEILLLLAIAIANFIFLSFRSCFKVKLDVVTPDYEEVKKNIDDNTKVMIKHNKDFLQGNLLTLGLYATLCVPVFVSLLLFSFGEKLIYYDQASEDEKDSFIFMLVL